MGGTREGWLYLAGGVVVLGVFFAIRHQMSVLKGLFYALGSILVLGGLAFAAWPLFFIWGGWVQGDLRIGASEQRYLMQGGAMLAAGIIAILIGNRV